MQEEAGLITRLFLLSIRLKLLPVPATGNHIMDTAGVMVLVIVVVPVDDQGHPPLLQDRL